MASLSACVIAKNEERVIEKSLKSIYQFVDEIVFVDTGSTDNTINIAKKFGSQIFHKKWADDFSIMYNFAFSMANSDYCILWDADFVLDEKSNSDFRLLKENNFDTQDQISVRWNTQFDTGGNPTAFVYRPLIFKSHKFTWKYPTHSIALPLEIKLAKIIKPEIIVNHLFDPSKRKKITNEHNQKVLGYLKSHPQDPYMNMAYIEESFAFGNHTQVIETANKFIHPLDQFPFPIQLLELMIFSLLKTNQISKASELIQSNVHKFLHLSRKFDILYADIMLFSDFNTAISLFEYASDEANYSFDQCDEYDLNRVRHAIEFSTLDKLA